METGPPYKGGTIAFLQLISHDTVWLRPSDLWFFNGSHKSSFFFFKLIVPFFFFLHVLPTWKDLLIKLKAHLVYETFL